MTLEVLKLNLSQLREIIREIYIFTNQLSIINNLESNSNSVINTGEKKLLKDSIIALTNQLSILNDSTAGLLDRIKFYKELKPTEKKEIPSSIIPKEKYVQIKYQQLDKKETIELVIDKKFKKRFLENLSKSNLSINKLKKKYSTVKYPEPEFGRSSFYAKISNKYFLKISNKLMKTGHLNKLNRDLRKVNSKFLIGTYTSMILFTSFIGLIVGFLLFIILLFFNISLLFPFLTLTEQNIFIRSIKFFWIIFLVPTLTGAFMYFYPSSEAKTIGAKIDQELPFLTIHMSAIASSGIEPVRIFGILLKSLEYENTNKSLRKITNLINFQGLDIVTALKETAKSSSSDKLRDLLDGMATSITSGGNLQEYLDKRAERLLFDYKLEREKYIKTSETFMNLYISIAIAAPMIFLMLFVIIGGTGMLSTFIGLDINSISILMLLAIVLLNIIFLVFLKFKQPLI